MLKVETKKTLTAADVITAVPDRIVEGFGTVKGGMITPEKKNLLADYLKSATELMAGKSRKEAKKVAIEAANNADLKTFTADAPETKLAISVEEEALKNASKQFGLKTKMAYATDADVKEADVLGFGMAGVATSMLAPLVAADPQLMGVALLAATTAYTVKTGAQMAGASISKSKSEADVSKVVDYSQIKHAQLALKQLKRAISEQGKEEREAADKELIARCFASGMGNPGGVIATLKNRQGR